LVYLSEIMKAFARNIVASILGWQVRRLQKKNDFKVIAVAGSVGKTSTKLAIANVLSAGLKTQFQNGNYNDLVTVPLIFFGQTEPNIFNPFAWLKVFINNEIQLAIKYPYEVVVVEIGTDAPGMIAEFKSYLRAEIAVLSAVTPEHTEHFGSMDAVEKEEMVVSEMASLTFVNKDMCKNAPSGDNFLSYAIEADADFKLSNITFDDSGCSFDALAAGKKILSAKHEALSEPQLYSILAAIAVAYKLGLDGATIEAGIAKIHPVAGRMQILAGINNSKIIDDTYNASPEAVKAALKTLYRMNAPQKIAILGNMNELGEFSEAEHTEIGNRCDPAQLDLVVTIGPDANKYLATTATKIGCRVESFQDPFAAGEFVAKQIKPGALILAKGSQNKVFAEETAKLLLADPNDSNKLVRQSKQWLKIKAQNFK